jgi:hypothetical protein
MADRELQEKLKSIVGVSVPRRTLNTYRRTAAARDESADHEGTPAAS